MTNCCALFLTYLTVCWKLIPLYTVNIKNAWAWACVILYTLHLFKRRNNKRQQAHSSAPSRCINCKRDKLWKSMLDVDLSQMRCSLAKYWVALIDACYVSRNNHGYIILHRNNVKINLKSNTVQSAPLFAYFSKI